MTECPFNLMLFVFSRATEELLFRPQSGNRARLPPAQTGPPKTTLRLCPESGTFPPQTNLSPTTVAGPPHPGRQEHRHSRPGRRSWRPAATWGMIRGRRRDRGGGSSERRGRRTDRPSCSCGWRTPNRLRWNPVSTTRRYGDPGVGGVWEPSDIICLSFFSCAVKRRGRGGWGRRRRREATEQWAGGGTRTDSGKKTTKQICWSFLEPQLKTSSWSDSFEATLRWRIRWISVHQCQGVSNQVADTEGFGSASEEKEGSQVETPQLHISD